MSKYQRHYIFAGLFFLLVQSTYFWEKELGIFTMLSFVLMALAFLCLGLLLLREVYLAVRDRGKDQKSLYFIVVLSVLLGLTIRYPNGLIDYSKFEPPTVLKAEGEGTANCRTTLNLSADHTFVERTICFGIGETRGTYFIKNDTIFFENVRLARHQKTYPAFALLKIQPVGEQDFGRLYRPDEQANNPRAGLVITYLDMARP